MMRAIYILFNKKDVVIVVILCRGASDFEAVINDSKTSRDCHEDITISRSLSECIDIINLRTVEVREETKYRD
jgi:hypothetical protein